MKTVYSPNLISIPSDVEIIVDVLETKEVAFTLVTNKKCKRKDKALSLSFIFSADSKSKTLLVLQASSLSKAVTSHSASKLVKTHLGLAVTPSLAATANTVKP